MPEESMKNVLSMISLYAAKHKLCPEAVRTIFNTGIGPVHELRPDLFEREYSAADEPKNAD